MDEIWFFVTVCYIVKVMLCYVKQCFNCLSIAHWCQVGLYCLYLLSTEIFEHLTCICISSNREMMERDSLCFNAPLFSMEIFKPFPKRNELIRKGAWRSNYTWPLRSKLSLSHIFMRLNQESNFKGTTLSSNSSWGKAFHQAEKNLFISKATCQVGNMSWVFCGKMHTRLANKKGPRRGGCSIPPSGFLWLILMPKWFYILVTSTLLHQWNLSGGWQDSKVESPLIF